MDETTPRIVGNRALPCHGRRAARLAVSRTPAVRACSICGAKYAISFVEEPHLSERLRLPVYRLDIVPWVDGRTRRRLERDAARDASAPMLPFGEPWLGRSR